MDKKHKIECSVCNCEYHSDDRTCNASSIQVSPTDAKTPNETGCMTFKNQK